MGFKTSWELRQEKAARKKRRLDRRKVAEEVIRRLERELPLSDSCRLAAKEYLRLFVIPVIEALGQGDLSTAKEITQVT